MIIVFTLYVIFTPNVQLKTFLRTLRENVRSRFAVTIQII